MTPLPIIGLSLLQVQRHLVACFVSFASFPNRHNFSLRAVRQGIHSLLVNLHLKLTPLLHANLHNMAPPHAMQRAYHPFSRTGQTNAPACNAVPPRATWRITRSAARHKLTPPCATWRLRMQNGERITRSAARDKLMPPHAMRLSFLFAESFQYVVEFS